MDAPTPAQSGEPAWLYPHTHEPNPNPPAVEQSLVLTRPDGSPVIITIADLGELPQQSIEDCYIVSTGHGTSGPFRFEGVTPADLFNACGVTSWSYADVISADGFGTRIYHSEINHPDSKDTASCPILLALACNGKALTRERGLVRLIVPQERGDALRQVKWVASIKVYVDAIRQQP